ncbi:energy-coupling factor transporter transmembrane component T family protein [Halalkalibacillus halophilus]|uniref:energy-coupling factor transporter transmembrane component T family protein n=1 Tax=Halalkalibacillus halophilus TaxID=392827 RepID=UPI0003FB39AE|nr:energy-coupling factor transporter transmembrane component T [Halalkalibacillus halophilus]
MNQSLIIGQFVPGESLIHRIDPRLKLVIIFIYVLVIFSAETLLSYGILFAIAISTAVLSRVPATFIIKGLKPVWFIIALTFLLHILLTREGEPLITVWGFSLYDQALLQGLNISARLLLLILMTTLLTLTTTPISITDAVEALLKPLKYVRFPVHELALMMSISLRFIPTIMQETDKIAKAQSSRGLDFTTGPIKDRLKAIIPLLIPLFVGAFKRAEDLALAMEARGYQGGEGRTKYRALTFQPLDLIVALVFVVVMTLFFVTRT